MSPQPRQSLWINIYSRDGGPKVGGVNLQIGPASDDDVRVIVENAVSHWAKQERQIGHFIAIYRHCHAQNDSYSLPFTAAEQLSPIVVHFR